MKLPRARRVARARSERNPGFTLAEVLIALLIVSGIMLALVQLLEATRITRDAIHNVQETQLAGPAIMDLIERDVRGMMVYDTAPDRLLKIKDRVLLGHDADRIDFVASTDSVVLSEVDHRLVRADCNEVGYVLRVNPRDDQFLEMYRREDFGVDEEPFDGGAYTFLHDQIKDFDIQVFEEEGPDAESIEDWGDDEEHVGLPLRIEIRLTLELAPRLIREQVRSLSADKRTVTYVRLLRIPQSLLAQVEHQPVPKIPVILDPGEAGGNGNGNGGGGDEGESTTPPPGTNSTTPPPNNQSKTR
jgi:prepilin-type N-terminal cleavage/methylation domain-containing protein